MAKINNCTQPAKQEEAKIIREINNSCYYGMIISQGKYSQEWNQILRYLEKDKSGSAILFAFSFGCIVGAREERARTHGPAATHSSMKGVRS